MSEPCTHERGDHDYPAAIGSFVAQTRALVKMTAERDAARAALARVRALCDSNIGVATRDGYLLVATIREALEGKTP